MSRFKVYNIENALESRSSCSNLSDLHLIEALCSQDDDSMVYSEFVNRFLPDLIDNCKRKCKSRKIDEHIGVDIAHQAFERVRKYKSFKKDKIKIPDSTKAIKLYLIRITLSLFNTHYRKENGKEVSHKCYFDDIFDAIAVISNVEELQNKKEITLLILKKLNEKEKKVVFADIEHKRNQKYLPDEITETLSIDLNVKKDSIRRIRKRAIEKIHIAINEINQN